MLLEDTVRLISDELARRYVQSKIEAQVENLLWKNKKNI